MSKKKALLILLTGAAATGAYVVLSGRAVADSMSGVGVVPDTGGSIPGGGNSAGQPASVRSNNPGAIRWNSENNWQGQDGYIVTAGGVKLCRFTSPEWGARAQIRLLRNYQSANPPARTTREIIRKWSGGEHADNYANFVAAGTGQNVDEVVNMASNTIAAHFAYHQARWEAGGTFYDIFTFTEGASLA